MTYAFKLIGSWALGAKVSSFQAMAGELVEHQYDNLLVNCLSETGRPFSRAEVEGEMINLSLSDLMEYTEWERQKRHEWMRQQGDQILKVSVGPNGDRFETVGDLVRHIFSAEKRYVERLAGQPVTDTTAVPNDNIEALFQFGRESRSSLKEFVETFPADKWDVPQQQNLVVVVISVTPRKSITHVLLHETRHWAQIGAMLRMAGYKGDFHDFLFCPAMGGIVRHSQSTASAR